MKCALHRCPVTWPALAAAALIAVVAPRAGAQGTATVKTHADCVDGLKAQPELSHCQGSSWLKAKVPLAGTKPLTTNQPRVCAEDGTCEANLVVLVNKPSAGKACQAVVQYDELTVKGFKQGRKLTWTLKDADVKAGYQFKMDADGGMRFITPKGGSAVPLDWWKVGPTSKNAVVSEVLKTPAAGATARLCHYPRVTDPGGRLCCPIDPIIINEP